MTKVEYLGIEFNKTHAIYLAGETVLGAMLFRIREPFKINFVKLKALGNSAVEWEEKATATSASAAKNNKKTGGDKKSTASQNKIITYSNYESFFNHEICFLKNQGNQDYYLQPGDYVYRFQINLPINLPSSMCYSTNARTKYYCMGIIDMDETAQPRLENVNCFRTFTVINHVDLNQNLALREPSEAKLSRAFGCSLCARSKPACITLKTRKGGYVPGELILCDVHVDNQSSQEMIFMGVKLFVEYKFHLQPQQLQPQQPQQQQKDREVVREWKHEMAKHDTFKKIMPKTSETFTNLGLRVPSTCPSTLNRGKIIEISYFVETVTDPSLLTVKSLILVGTIPIREAASMNAKFSLQPQMKLPGLLTNDSMQPAFEKPKGVIVQNDSKAYLPVYPYYDFNI